MELSKFITNIFNANKYTLEKAIRYKEYNKKHINYINNRKEDLNLFVNHMFIEKFNLLLDLDLKIPKRIYHKVVEKDELLYNFIEYLDEMKDIDDRTLYKIYKSINSKKKLELLLDYGLKMPSEEMLKMIMYSIDLKKMDISLDECIVCKNILTYMKYSRCVNCDKIPICFDCDEKINQCPYCRK